MDKMKHSLRLLAFLLFLSIVNGAIVYVSQENGENAEGCGTASESPCATLIYVFEPAYNLQDASIVQLSEGTYDATNLQITQTDITIQSEEPTKMAEINIVGTEGITVLANGLILQNLEFRNIDIEGNLFDINITQAEITLVRCNFDTINAFYIFQGDQDLDFINFSVVYAYEITANSFIHASSRKFTFDYAIFSSSNYSGAAVNIVSSDITATDTRVSSTYLQTGLFLISTNFQSVETTENITISIITGSDITTEHPLINIGVNQENTFINIDTISLSSTTGPIIAIASEQHYGEITINNIDLVSANVDANTPTWLFNFVDANSVVISNVNVQNSLANLLYVDEILSQNVFNILISNSWQRESLFSSLIYFTNSDSVSLSNVTLTNNENLEGDIQFSNVKSVSVTGLSLADNQFNQEGAILLLQNTITSVLNNCYFADNVNSATISVVRSNYDFISTTTIENTVLDTLYFDCSSNSTLSLKNNTYGVSYCASVKANPNYLESDDVCRITGTDVVPCEEEATATEAWYAIVMIVVFGLIGLTVFTVIIVSAVYFLTKRRQAYSGV